MNSKNVATPKITRTNLIAQKLEALIVDGHLQPGDKVPSERQLCQRFDTSRASVREAIKLLRGRELIDTQQGKGTYVNSLVKEVDEETPLSRLYNSHPGMLYDLLDVRELLEGQATFLAAERGTDKDFYHITKAYKNMNTSPTTSELTEVAKLDHIFHKAIYEASHNPVLIHTLQSLMQLMRSSVETSVKRLYLRTKPKKIIDEDHKTIFSLIMARKPEEAQTAAMSHVRNIRYLMLEIERDEQRDDRAQFLYK